ncbi:type II CRISPR-associated endonuclease Cas1 [Petrocella sp. FN5]|uniref:type II CRISPR-associated endonuclease Cas1 n=1 Tax=Petrocella sp. FN5 TaxID=3032002 RepID=UPI0023DCE6E5|nr:type II CRISPR-associated endonuclease Cas1 [Petrocella sp. FN5]MDF1618741.1 type II CRISPR-associated endonuclease Cas1 [Petrocella sp. FN5]
MAFRVILIESDAIIRYKLDNLMIQISEKSISIPLRDISTIVIDNHNTSLSTRVLNMIAKENVCLIICGLDHMPIGIFTGFCNHSRASKVIAQQVALTQDIKEDFWCKIVIAKLMNQSKMLSKLGYEDNITDQIKAFTLDVKSGDSSNREAHGAKVYFNRLMGKSFSRGDDSILMNSGLNYGYTILRSYIARLCVGYGLNTMLGLHHRSEYNQFNLVDDLIEPLRPFVDYYVYGLLCNEKQFTYQHRQALVNIVNHKVFYKNKKQYLANALDEYIGDICDAIKNQDFTYVNNFDFDDYLGET